MDKHAAIRRKTVVIGSALVLTIALMMGMTMNVSAASAAAKKRNTAYR